MKTYSDAQVNNICRARFESEYGYDPLNPPERESHETCSICGDEIESVVVCDNCKQTIIDELVWLKKELKTDWGTLWDAIDSVWEEAEEKG